MKINTLKAVILGSFLSASKVNKMNKKKKRKNKTQKESRRVNR